MVTITARCHPALEPILPRPVPAGEALPDWFRAMPATREADTLGGESVRTLKHCPPFIDALSLGLLMPLAADLTVTAGEVTWAWDPPILEDADIVRAPVGVHVPEQAEGAPLAPPGGDGSLILKFTSFWTLAVPEGHSLLFTHPLNRPDLPFRTLAGVVDCDRFADGYVHFPALLDPGFEGVIPAGTPVAQVIPLPGRETALETRAMTGAETAANRALQAALGETPGIYRRDHRR
ncbi:MAG: hypothetical protein AAFR52_05165 [Pseudomonadota bacterium]